MVWIAGQDRSMWRTLRPSAGQAQQWVRMVWSGQGRSPPRPLLAVPNVAGHPSTASLPVTVVRDSGPLIRGFNVSVKGRSSSSYAAYCTLNVDCGFHVSGQLNEGLSNGVVLRSMRHLSDVARTKRCRLARLANSHALPSLWLSSTNRSSSCFQI